MISEDSELLKEFAIESQEHLSDIENQLLTLESQGDNVDVALVNTVFRAIHSIKGAAGFMGLETLGGLAHRAEEVLNRLRNKELRPTSVVVNTLLRAADRLKELIDQIETSNEADVTSHLSALEQILSGDSTGPEAEPPPAIAQSAAGAQAHAKPTCQIQTLAGEALREFLVECFDNLEQVERDVLVLERQPDSEAVLNSIFRNVHTIKGSAGFLGFNKLEHLTHAAENLLGSVRSGTFAYDSSVSELLLKAVDGVRRILHFIESMGGEGAENFASLIEQFESLQKSRLAQQNARAGSKSRSSIGPKKAVDSETIAVNPNAVLSTPASSQTSESKLEPKPASPVQSPAPPVPAAMPTKAAAAASQSGSAETSAAESTIRVDVALLDKLMNCVGELVLARNQIIQFTNGQVDSELHRTSQRLNLITTELQEGVMKTRMQPIGNVWSKFPRLVRDLATMCEKQVRIEMEGKETELDKTIIEAIKDPLTHLVRNTVDHGIERPEIRAQRGKPVEGCLVLRAYHEGGQVNIEISDDGAGLNLERIKAKAVERGLMTQEQVSRMADRDVGNLIFLPGFSTAEKVSNVSGRGVGMDVVKTNIEKIGGSVDLQSQAGQGTTIKIKIPLTLAIIPALIVTNDGNRYAIPQVNLLELLRLDGELIHRSIERIQGAPVYRLRGNLLPLVYLREQLKTVASAESLIANQEALNIVVLRAEDRQFGLVVDKINDTEEIVVKPLGKQLKSVSVYSGTTIMGDGKVALILDVLGLAHNSNLLSKERSPAVLEMHDRNQNSGGTSQALLVLGVGPARRFALPLSEVTRLEKIDPSTIESADDQQVVQYRGEILPLINLANCVGAMSSAQAGDPLEVVVYSECGRSVGIIVDRIVDIVDERLEIKRQAQRHGLLGSAVIQGHVTDILDLPAVIRTADPMLFAHQEAAHQEAAHQEA